MLFRSSFNMNTVKLSDKHLAVISNALEVYYRLKSGQVGIALDTAYDYKLSWEQKEVVEKQIKLMLFPELHSNAAYGFNSDKIGDAKVAYEVKKTFEEFLSVKNNDGCWGTGTNFRGPLKASDEPFPDILDFKKYKDYPFIIINPLNGSMCESVRKNFPKAEIICVDSFGIFSKDLTNRGYRCYNNIGDVPKMKKRPVLLINSPYTTGTQDATNVYVEHIENAVTKLNPIAILNIAPDNFLTGGKQNEKLRNNLIAKYGKPT